MCVCVSVELQFLFLFFKEKRQPFCMFQKLNFHFYEFLKMKFGNWFKFFL